MWVSWMTASALPQVIDLDLALAGHRAGVAGPAIDEDGVAHGLAADGLGVLEGAVPEIAGGQDAGGFEGQDSARRSDLVEAVGGAVIVLLEPHELALGLLLVARHGRLGAEIGRASCRERV